ncbi:hypothetical protein Tco_1323104 [Tanacetum coccineum]
MAAVEVPQTLEYRGGQLNSAPVLELVKGSQKDNGLEMRERLLTEISDSKVSSCLNINHVKDSELPSIFGKLKYKENLIDNIYETKKNKSLISATPLSTAFDYTSIVQDFQDSPDDEEDTRSSHEFSITKATDQTECYKYGKRGYFASDCWSKASVPSYQSSFQLKPLSSSQHKPELRPTKDFEAKYNKVKAKLVLLSLSASASKATTVKNKSLICNNLYF